MGPTASNTLTHDLCIAVAVSNGGRALLSVDSAPVTATLLPLGRFPALAGGHHDAAGVSVGTGRQAIFQPLAQHLAGRHTRVPLSHDQKLSVELAAFVVPLVFLHGLHTEKWRHLPHLQELFAGLQVGHRGGSVTQSHHLVEALHAQVGA